MRVALIALPWSSHIRPSGALGALAAHIRREEPRVTLDVYYEYLTVAERLGTDVYQKICDNSYTLGELLYCPHLYPESPARHLSQCVSIFMSISTQERAKAGLAPSAANLLRGGIEDRESKRIYVQQLILELGSHLDDFVARLGERYDLVGLTTVFGQLFANLALAKRLRAVAPKTKILLGGSTLSAQVGPSIMREYDFIDFIIQGEGETPLLGLIRAVQAGDAAPDMQGLLARAADSDASAAQLSEVTTIDDLAVPDFDEYAVAAERLGIDWMLPVEGSRGCWWDRSARTNNPRKTCYFCNLNVQWKGYREKSEERIIDELEQQSRRYGRSRVFFLDNVIRIKGIEKLASGIRGLGRGLNFFYEARANLKPYEILVLWEAGLDRVQFGIEGLSTAYLRRIGKGTTAMQNLQVMKICAELNIWNGANLLTEFPGTTPVEVEETRRIIEDYAHAYQPLQVAKFWLGMGSTVDALKHDFPITNLRNNDFYALGVPDRVYREVRFFDLSFDLVGAPAGWAPVYQVSEWWDAMWSRCRENGNFPLSYREAGGRVSVTRREPVAETYVFTGLEAELFLFCQEMRALEEINAVVAERASAPAVRDLLDGWVTRHLAYREGRHYLVLACAETAAMAQARIRRYKKGLSLPPTTPMDTAGDCETVA